MTPKIQCLSLFAGTVTVGTGGITITGTLTVNDGNITLTAGTGVIDCVGHYEVDGIQVVGNQGAVVADASAGNHLTQFNTLLARLRAHGLIDT